MKHALLCSSIDHSGGNLRLLDRPCYLDPSEGAKVRLGASAGDELPHGNNPSLGFVRIMGVTGKKMPPAITEQRAYCNAAGQPVESQFEGRGSNFCAEGLCWIASVNHGTNCIAAASVASFDV